MKNNKSNSDFINFWETLTGYRESFIFLLLGKTKLIDKINSFGKNGANSEAICKQMNWNHETGTRFLDCLWYLGILEKESDLFISSRFSKHFFSSGSTYNQNNSLDFENKLVESWSSLENVLVTGKRSFRKEEKSGEQYNKALHQYLGSMDEAAKIRSQELWEIIKCDETGTILDAGAGSGAYITAFLEKYNKWNGIFCDLKDVIDLARKNKKIERFGNIINFFESNLLDDNQNLNYLASKKIDIALLSNIIHCQGREETRGIFNRISNILPDKSMIVIHDFFKDISWHGALYDLHMMLNTYNGRTYTIQEIIDDLKETGFKYSICSELPSKSAIIIATRDSEILNKIYSIK